MRKSLFPNFKLGESSAQLSIPSHNYIPYDICLEAQNCLRRIRKYSFKGYKSQFWSYDSYSDRAENIKDQELSHLRYQFRRLGSPKELILDFKWCRQITDRGFKYIFQEISKDPRVLKDRVTISYYHSKRD